MTEDYRGVRVTGGLAQLRPFAGVRFRAQPVGRIGDRLGQRTPARVVKDDRRSGDVFDGHVGGVFGLAELGLDNSTVGARE
ncbi:hypothetical protein [Allorhizocola rhizosphaerae]|uniref:hypothetical protein n=1 Tax=Allorhizocola rhizosphaerae TaxID=1872709 RepID=UPI0013C2E288|nr:hypothetical protein [Allorhizocola rhizosphaerae]